MEKRKRTLTSAANQYLLRAQQTVPRDCPAAEESEGKRLAAARLREAFDIGLVSLGEPTWSREDLYKR